MVVIKIGLIANRIVGPFDSRDLAENELHKDGWREQAIPVELVKDVAAPPQTVHLPYWIKGGQMAYIREVEPQL